MSDTQGKTAPFPGEEPVGAAPIPGDPGYEGATLPPEAALREREEKEERDSRNGPRVVAGALLGYDTRTVIIGGQPYVITPPTLHRLAGAAYWLSGYRKLDTMHDILCSLKDIRNLAHAISWFIRGDDSLYGECLGLTLTEAVAILDTAFTLVSTQDFLRLSVLTRSAGMLTAKQK